MKNQNTKTSTVNIKILKAALTEALEKQDSILANFNAAGEEDNWVNYDTSMAEEDGRACGYSTALSTILQALDGDLSFIATNTVKIEYQ